MSKDLEKFKNYKNCKELILMLEDNTYKFFTVKKIIKIFNIYKNYPSFLNFLAGVLKENMAYFQSAKSEEEIEKYLKEEEGRLKNVLGQFSDWAGPLLKIDVYTYENVLKMRDPKNYLANPLILVYLFARYKNFFLRYRNKKAKKECYTNDTNEKDIIYNVGKKIIHDTVKIVTIVKNKNLIREMYDMVIRYEKLRWNRNDGIFITPEHLAFHSFCSITRYSKNNDILKYILEKAKYSNLNLFLCFITYLRAIFKGTILDLNIDWFFLFAKNDALLEKILDLYKPTEAVIKKMWQVLEMCEKYILINNKSNNFVKIINNNII